MAGLPEDDQFMVDGSFDFSQEEYNAAIDSKACAPASTSPTNDCLDPQLQEPFPTSQQSFPMPQQAVAMPTPTQTFFGTQAHTYPTQISHEPTMRSQAQHILPQQQSQAPTAQMWLYHGNQPMLSPNSMDNAARNTFQPQPIAQSSGPYDLPPTTPFNRMLNNRGFCAERMRYQLNDGRWVEHRNTALLRAYPELRRQITDRYVSLYEAATADEGRVTTAGAQLDFPVFQGGGEGEVQQGSMPAWPNDALPESEAVMETDTAHTTESFVPMTMRPAPRKTLQLAPNQIFSSASAPLANPTQNKVTSPMEDAGEETQGDNNDAASTASADENITPINYVPDLVSIDAARDLLAHPDPSGFTPLEIANDDLATEKGKMHDHAGLLFLALQQKGVKVPPKPIVNADLDFRAKVKARYELQQKEALEKIHRKLRTPQGQKEARARCLVLFEEAIKVHELGVPTEIHEEANAKPKERKSRAPHLNLKATCSERLGLIEGVLQKYKLVAVDVLQGKNLEGLTLDPDHAAVVKSMYLESNTRRQMTADAKKAAGQKRKAGSEEEEGEENDDGIEEYLPPPKPKKAKKPKAKK